MHNKSKTYVKLNYVKHQLTSVHSNINGTYFTATDGRFNIKINFSHDIV